jgi:hypothetical protein
MIYTPPNSVTQAADPGCRPDAQRGRSSRAAPETIALPIPRSTADAVMETSEAG